MIDKGISAILFDCSTLLRWNRPVTGIVRAQLEVAKYLLHCPYKTIFVAFSPDKQALLQVSKETLQNKIDFFMHGSPPQKPFNPLKRLSAVPRRLKKFADSMQHSKILRFVERIQFKSSQLKSYADGINSEISPLFLPPIARSTRALFNKETLFITMGLDWEDSNYALLYQLKHELRFRVVGMFCDAFILKNPQWAASKEIVASFMLHFYHLSYLCDSIASISDYSKDEFHALLAAHRIAANPLVYVLSLGNCDKPKATTDIAVSTQPAPTPASRTQAPLPVVVTPTITLHRDPISGELIGDDSPEPAPALSPKRKESVRQKLPRKNVRAHSSSMSARLNRAKIISCCLMCGNVCCNPIFVFLIWFLLECVVGVQTHFGSGSKMRHCGGMFFGMMMLAIPSCKLSMNVHNFAFFQALTRGLGLARQNL